MYIYVFGALRPMADNVFFSACGPETTWSSGQRLRTSVSATKPLHVHSQARKMKIIEDALALAGRKCIILISMFTRYDLTLSPRVSGRTCRRFRHLLWSPSGYPDPKV